MIRDDPSVTEHFREASCRINDTSKREVGRCGCTRQRDIGNSVSVVQTQLRRVVCLKNARLASAHGVARNQNLLARGEEVSQGAGTPRTVQRSLEWLQGVLRSKESGKSSRVERNVATRLEDFVAKGFVPGIVKRGVVKSRAQGSEQFPLCRLAFAGHRNDRIAASDPHPAEGKRDSLLVPGPGYNERHGCLDA